MAPNAFIAANELSAESDWGCPEVGVGRTTNPHPKDPKALWGIGKSRHWAGRRQMGTARPKVFPDYEPGPFYIGRT
jgi:hypothetical protein